jgi:rRNA maturation endonuclease Nob1
MESDAEDSNADWNSDEDHVDEDDAEEDEDMGELSVEDKGIMDNNRDENEKVKQKPLMTSQEEVQNINETLHLFKSNLFKLQV